MSRFKFWVNLSFIAWWLFLIASVGIYTHWFKYGPGIEGISLAMYFIPTSSAVIFLWFSSFIVRKNQDLYQISTIIVVLLLGIVFPRQLGINYFDRQSWHWNYVETSAIQSLRTQIGEYNYHYKSVNPGSGVERNYLIISNQGKTFEIPIVYMPSDGASADIANYKVPVVLYPTLSGKIYISELYSLLNVSYFSIDLEKKTALYLTGVQSNGGSCDVPGEEYGQICTFIGDKLFFDETNKQYLGFGVYNTLDSHNTVIQYKFIHLALGGDHNYFLPFGSTDESLPVLQADDLTSWGRILNIKGDFLTVETFNKAGNHKLIIDVNNKILKTAP